MDYPFILSKAYHFYQFIIGHSYANAHTHPVSKSHG